MATSFFARQSLAPAAQTLFLIILAILLAVPWFVDDEALVRGILLAVALVILLVWLNFKTLTVRIERGVLKVGFPVFNSTIVLEDVESVRREWISALKSGGVGLRLRPKDGLYWAYVAKSSEGLRLKIKGRSSDVAFTCDAPERILEVMRLEVPKLHVEGAPS